MASHSPESAEGAEAPLYFQIGHSRQVLLSIKNILLVVFFEHYPSNLASRAIIRLRNGGTQPLTLPPWNKALQIPWH